MEIHSYAVYKNNIEYLKVHANFDEQSLVLRSLQFEGPGSIDHSELTIKLASHLVGLNCHQILEVANSEIGFNCSKVTVEPLWLLYQVINQMLGRDFVVPEKNDVICLCFGLSKSDILKEMNQNYSLDFFDIVQSTRASTACGSCKEMISTSILKIRDQGAIVKGMGHVRSRFDCDGKWLRVSQMYPADLVIKIDELIAQWISIENLQGKIEIEIINLEGYYVDIAVKSTVGDAFKLKNIQKLGYFLNQKLDAKLILNF